MGGEPTFARARLNGQVAPIPVVRGTAIEIARFRRIGVTLGFGPPLFRNSSSAALRTSSTPSAITDISENGLAWLWLATEPSKGSRPRGWEKTLAESIDWIESTSTQYGELIH